MRSCAILWSGFPWYAAHAVKELLSSCSVRVELLGTRPAVPMTNIEGVIGATIRWLDWGRRYSWQELGIACPAVCFYTAWNCPAFNSLSNEVSAQGGRTVCMIDNNLKGSFRQACGAIYFRLFMRSKFDLFWVPGEASIRFLEYMGVPREKVFKGLYCCDPKIFTPGSDCAVRERRVLFVGQMIQRKGVSYLVDAFVNSPLVKNGWQLELIGSGPEHEKYMRMPGVSVRPFAEPSEVAGRMQQARIFVLPSLEEHWGVVLAEAAMCRCVLVSTSSTGAVEDLIDDENGVVVRCGRVDELRQSLINIANWSTLRTNAAGNRSRALAMEFAVKRWKCEFEAILCRCNSIV